MLPDQPEGPPRRIYAAGFAYPVKSRLVYRDRVLVDSMLCYTGRKEADVVRELLLAWAQSQLHAKEARQPDVSSRG